MIPQSDTKTLRAMVMGGYDIQKVRIQCGLRLCANFRAKLKIDLEEEETDDGELSERAESILAKLRESYRCLTDGIAKNRTLPSAKGFKGDELISTHAELTLVHQYEALLKTETQLFSLLMPALEAVPIYNEYLVHQRGVGPQMAGVLISCLDPAKARHPSSFWRYAGLDVGPDGRGRSRRQEHLVDRTYTDRNGDEKTRKGVTYNPFLKTKLAGVLSGSFLRANSPWRKSYDDYKHRISTDPARTKATVVEWKKRHRAGEEVAHLWTPKRIDNAAKRYMVKMFLADLWLAWRKLEGLPLGASYHEAVLSHRHAAE